MRALCLSALFSLFCCGLAGAEQLRLTSGEWPPYLGQQLPHNGVASRIVAEAFALQGVEVQWEFHPWARALQLAESGQRAGSAVWRRSKEREAMFFISDPVLQSGHYLFQRKDYEFDWKQLSDLQGRRIAATRGYDYGEAFQQAEASGHLQVNRVTSDETALRQLLGNRVDLFPINQVVGLDLLHQHFSAAERARLTIHPTPLTSKKLHLLLSRKLAGNAELLRRFNLGLKQLHDSGKVALYLLESQQPLSLAP